MKSLITLFVFVFIFSCKSENTSSDSYSSREQMNIISAKSKWQTIANLDQGIVTNADQADYFADEEDENISCEYRIQLKVRPDYYSGSLKSYYFNGARSSEGEIVTYFNFINGSSTLKIGDVFEDFDHAYSLDPNKQFGGFQMHFSATGHFDCIPDGLYFLEKPSTSSLAWLVSDTGYSFNRSKVDSVKLQKKCSAYKQTKITPTKSTKKKLGL
ncbi:MAG: hypothetical protein H6621_04965 [Halobacteriovoraceae bacterium]|nr:hypothetical protein [Halobacteriovoraceae bacterium]